MRRLILVSCILFCCGIVFSQKANYSGHQLVDEFNRLHSATTKAISEEDYILAEKRVSESIEYFYTLPPDVQKKFQLFLANNYYTLSGIYSIQRKKEEAIKSFEKAVESGFINYQHATTDTSLDYIRNDKQVITLLDKIRPLGDYQYILKQAAGYKSDDRSSAHPVFIYEKPESKPLQKVREYLKLDSIAGNGNEISRIINIMTWVHNTIPHLGNGWPVSELNAIDIYNYSKANNRKALNCKAISIVLNECYLAMGFKSRIVSCYPKNQNDFESHVLNIVYSETLDKWLWMDATFNAYLTDENDNLLNIAEVRERLINDKPVNLNKDANWNGTPWSKERYFDNYMTRFLYWLQCPVRSVFNSESGYRDTNEEVVALMPVGYTRDNIPQRTYITHDANYFWQDPNQQK